MRQISSANVSYMYRGKKEAHMKKRIMTFLVAFAICICGSWNLNTESYAKEESENADLSYLLTEDALIGYAENQTRGVYLANGYSIINKISSTKIGAGGVTNASQYCKVAINVIVERQTSTGWARVTSWNATSNYGITAAVDRTLNVGTGYYYRVRSLHYAGTDASSSCTSALPM